MCDYIAVHEDIILISTFVENRVVMRKMTRVIREAHLVERKRRQTSRMKRMDKSKTRTHRAEELIGEIKLGGMMKDEIEKSLERIFGERSSREIEKTSSKEWIVERIEEMSKRESQLDEWEKMMQEAKKRLQEDWRLNLFWRRNECFPAQCVWGGGGERERGNTQCKETLEFWRAINNKEVSERLSENTSIREVLHQVRMRLQRRVCR